MKRVCRWLIVISPMLISSAASARAETQQPQDPFGWLEELQSQRSLDWVNSETGRTIAELTKNPLYPALYADIRHGLDLSGTIVYPQIIGDRLYNLWQDSQHPRGIWRRTTWDNYLRGAPAWETVLDLDSLAVADRVAWTFSRVDCLEPENRYCLLELSRDGSEVTEIRQLDIETRRFVKLEISRPEPKPRLARLARAEMPDVERRPHQSSSDGDVYMIRDQVIVYLHEAWTIGDATWPAGSIIATSLGDFLTAKRNFTLVMVAGPRETIEAVSATRDYLVVNVLNNVSSELRRYRHENSKWQFDVLRAPDMGSMDLISTSTTTNRFFFTYASFLQPTTLYVAGDGGSVQEVKRLPATFSASGLVVDQSEAVSKDGTRIPFFLVHRSTLVRDGSNPTLLYAYGGFELSSTPGYGLAVGPAWLGRGGVYVVANVRGGGEFGPAWHTAATRENRQRVYDDFTAVAEELIRQGITSPSHLGIIGASNGGLLAGVAITQRPDLFNGAVVQSALLDMQRYRDLNDARGWVSEYGDPDKPEDWAYMSKYSPYQNLKPNTKYPAAMFVTNLLDDRVHPGHVRKMAAKMESMGQPVYYFENASGGHATGLSPDESARTLALVYTFLWQQLALRTEGSN